VKALKWTSIVLAALVALVLIFYAEEDLRGWHAWQKCKHEFEAKGFVLDWDKFIPPPVPADRNFFAAPKMQAWFVRNPNATGDLTKRLANPKTSTIGTTNGISSEKDARDYLAWSDQFTPDFNLIREALKRPYARMEGDYHDPVAMPIPDFVAVRAVAQTLAQRAHSHLLLNQPEQALEDLTLLHDLCRLLQVAPTGKPMTLVAAMINVAVAGLYTDAAAEGVRQHIWQEAQLAELQKQFAEVHLTPFVLEALREGPVRTCREVEMAYGSWLKLWNVNRQSRLERFCWWFWPSGWTYQNMVNVTKMELNTLDGFDEAHDTISPGFFEQNLRDLNKFVGRGISPYRLIAAIAIPNFNRACQTTAHNQTMANQAQIACALERYRLAHGGYPETFDALVPQFIEKLPHDIIGGQPLHYHRTSDGKFLLYSVGWNETDDGGQVVLKEDGSVDREKSDWVWR